MAPRERSHVRRALIGLTVILAALAGGGAALWMTGVDLEAWRGTPSAEPSGGDRGAGLPTASPSGAQQSALNLPDPAPTTPVVAPARGATLTPDPAQLQRSLAAALSDRHLGRHVVVGVADLDGDGPVFSSGRGPFVPASTNKLLTTTAALARFGPDHVFSTSVVADGRRIVLVGGGDPYLARRPLPASAAEPYPQRTDLATLAAATADALRGGGHTTIRLGYDAGLFTGPAFAQSWETDYATDGIVSPISSLWVDEGRRASGSGRVADPAADAARLFARQLTGRGIRVLGAPVASSASAQATLLASVDSAPLAQIVERILEVSDNEAAEVLGHHVGLDVVRDGSFDGGARGVLQTLRELGVPVEGARLFDASGLSRANRLDPRTLLGVLQLAASEQHPHLRPVITGLPVAGFTGSLTYRLEQAPPAARGLVRAKTGTLSGVSGLAGITTDADGNQLAFVLVADRVRLRNTLAARTALDTMSGRLAVCHCSR